MKNKVNPAATQLLSSTEKLLFEKCACVKPCFYGVFKEGCMVPPIGCLLKNLLFVNGFKSTFCLWYVKNADKMQNGEMAGDQKASNQHLLKGCNFIHRTDSSLTVSKRLSA